MTTRSGAGHLSVVILTHNEGQRLLDTVTAMLQTTPADTEIVVVDDSSTDGSTQRLDDPRVRVLQPARRLGVAGGRNYGARHVTGSVVVFSDAHVQPSPGWVDPLVEALADPAVGAVAPAIGHLDGRSGTGHGYTWADLSLRMKWLRAADDQPVDVPFLCGCFVAMRRDVFLTVGGFDEGMYRWGSEDSELCLRLWLLGYACRAVPAAHARHLFRDSFPYAVDGDGVVFNILRLAALHFSDEGLGRLVAAHAGRPGFVRAWPRLLDSDTWRRRRDIDAVRVRDAAWFGERFAVDAVG